MGEPLNGCELTAEARQAIVLLRHGLQSLHGLAETLGLNLEQTQHVLQRLSRNVGIVRLFRHTRGQGLQVNEVPTVRPEFQAHQWIIREFLDWLDGGPEPATVLRDNIKSAAMLFGAIDASAGGQTIDVEAKARSAEG